MYTNVPNEGLCARPSRSNICGIVCDMVNVMVGINLPKAINNESIGNRMP